MFLYLRTQGNFFQRHLGVIVMAMHAPIDLRTPNFEVEVLYNDCSKTMTTT